MNTLRDWIIASFGFGMRPQMRDREACEKLYFWAYLWPKLRLHLDLHDRMAVSSPDHRMRDDPFELQSTLSAIALGDRMEPNVQIRATSKLIKGLAEISDELEREVHELERSRSGVKVAG